MQSDWKAAKKNKDNDALRAVLERAGVLHGACADDAKMQLAVLKFVGTAAKGSRGDEIKTMVLQQLADIGDVRCAKYVKPYLRQRDAERSSPVLVTAIATASEVPDASFVNPLLKIVTTSKHTGVLADAVVALGKFKDAKRQRAKIIEVLTGEARKVKPGNRPRMRGSQEQLDSSSGSGHYGRESGPGARWAALAGSVPVALRELTGQDVRSLGEWMAMAKQYKGKLGELFVD